MRDAGDHASLVVHPKAHEPVIPVDRGAAGILDGGNGRIQLRQVPRRATGPRQVERRDRLGERGKRGIARKAIDGRLVPVAVDTIVNRMNERPEPSFVENGRRATPEPSMAWRIVAEREFMARELLATDSFTALDTRPQHAMRCDRIDAVDVAAGIPKERPVLLERSPAANARELAWPSHGRPGGGVELVEKLVVGGLVPTGVPIEEQSVVPTVEPRIGEPRMHHVRILGGGWKPYLIGYRERRSTHDPKPRVEQADRKPPHPISQDHAVGHQPAFSRADQRRIERPHRAGGCGRPPDIGQELGGIEFDTVGGCGHRSPIVETWSPWWKPKTMWATAYGPGILRPFRRHRGSEDMANALERLRFWWVRERAARANASRDTDGIASGIAHLRALCPGDDPEDREEPIFLLSAGWRSGSTLLQRCIMSDSRVLMWGEPYQESGLVQSLAAAARAFRADWPKPKWFHRDTRPALLAADWVANLFPHPEDWRLGQRALFDVAFSRPAFRSGARRWGIKEVRWTSDHARYLRWLYPRCRLVFLYRNPLAAYQSYLKRGGGWYDTYPGGPVFTPMSFGSHWKKLAESFVRDARQLDAMVLRFEEVVGGREWVGRLEHHLDIRIDRSILDVKLDGAEAGALPVALGRAERWLLRRSVSPVAKNLGYTW